MFEGAARSFGEGSNQFEELSGQSRADSSNSGIRKRAYKGKLPLHEEPPLMPPGFPSIEPTGRILSPLMEVPLTKTEKKRDTPWKKSPYKGTLKMQEVSPLVKNHPRLPAGKKQKYTDEHFQKMSAQLEAEPETLVLDPVEEKYKGIIPDTYLREILKMPKEFQGGEISKALKEQKVVEARKASRAPKASLSRKDFVPFRDQEEAEKKVEALQHRIHLHHQERAAGKRARPVERQAPSVKKQPVVTTKDVEEEGELLDAADLKEISMKEYKKIEQAQKLQKERRSFLGSIKNLFRGFWS